MIRQVQIDLELVLVVVLVEEWIQQRDGLGDTNIHSVVSLGECGCVGSVGWGCGGWGNPVRKMERVPAQFKWKTA